MNAWTRHILDDTDPSCVETEYVHVDGWRITKEWYASGASMFEFVLTHDHDDMVWERYDTLRAAKAAIVKAASDRCQVCGSPDLFHHIGYHPPT